MTPLADSASTTILAQVVNSAARALVLSGVAALGLAVFRVKATAVRLFTWTAVLYAALAMPLLQRLLPTLPVPTPAALQFAIESASPAEPISSANNSGTLPHEDTAQTSTVIINQRQREATERRAAAPAEPSLKMPSPSVDSALVSPPPSDSLSVGWSTIAAAIYFAGVLLFVLRFTVGLAFARKLQRASRLIPDPRIKLRLASFARASGLSSVPPSSGIRIDIRATDHGRVARDHFVAGQLAGMGRRKTRRRGGARGVARRAAGCSHSAALAFASRDFLVQSAGLVA